MSYPAVLKKELVLSFRFKRVGASWKHAHQAPKVLRLANRDCSQEFSSPLLIWGQGRLTVEARIYDDTGIDIANATSLLGDWGTAIRRCEELLVASARRADAAAERQLGPEISWLINALMPGAINERP